MKKALFGLFLVSFLSSCVAQNSGYNIQFKVKGYKDTTCYLGNHFGDKQYIRDTAMINSKGIAVFTGKKSLPAGIYLGVMPGKTFFEFIVTEENQTFSLETDKADLVGKMKVSGSPENSWFFDYLQFVYKRGFMVDSLKKMIKKGTPEDSVRLTEKIRAIDKEVVEYKDEFIKKHPESFMSVVFRAQTEPVVPKAPILPNGRPDSTFSYRYFKSHYFDNMKLYDSRLLRTPVYARKLEFYVKNLIVPVPDSVNKDVDDLLFRIRSYMFNPKFRIADTIIFSNEKKFEKYEDNKAKYFKGIPDSVFNRLKGAREMFKYTLWYLTSNYEKSNIMGMDAVFVHLVEKYYATRQAFWVDSAQLVKFMSRAISMDPVLLNRPAAELMLPDTSGQYVSLKQIKTPLVILYFWDPDCGHCTTETPKLVDEYHKLLKEGFDITVYAVYTEKEKYKEWKAFIRKHNLDWINVWDPYDQSSFKKKFDVYSTPVLYLLNDKKEIIAKRLQADQLDNFLKKIYKKK